jgi:hypothetical protein
MTAPLEPDLVRLGDALQEAAARDLAATPAAAVHDAAPGRLRPRRRRLFLGGLLAAAILIPAAAVAADRLISTDDVAASMPAGTLSLAGTEPACTVVKENVEFHCVLKRPPAPEVSDWKGTVEPTVDRTKHVNGGCRSLVSEGTVWQCYLGREAVRQQIISDGFLGEVSEGPGVG